MKILLFILFPIIAISQSAFPTSVGFGKNTTGGSGGAIIHVTNLNDTGAGSLRAALETTGARTIVFDVGGDIKVNTRLTVGSGGNYLANSATNALYENVTIAGETAPFPGITIRAIGASSGLISSVMRIQASNVIVRYITFRTDDGNTTSADALNVINLWDDEANDGGTYQYDLQNVILDHITISNGSDENFAIQGVTNFTLQNSLSGNSDNSGYNILFGYRNYNTTFINNLLTHDSYRNPLIGYGIYGSTVEFINNIVFGYDTGGTDVVWGNNADIIANVYKAWENNAPNGASIKWDPNATNNPGAVITDGSFYASGNIQENPLKHDFGLLNSNAISANEASRVILNSTITTWKTTVSDIKYDILNVGYGVGNSIHRDAFDTTAISDYVNGSNERELDAFIPDKTLATRPVSDDDDNGGGGDDMLDAVEVVLFGSDTATNNPNGLTSTNWVSKKDGSSINAYSDLRKTHFYLAGDLVLAGGTTEGVTALTGKKTGEALLIAN